MNNELGWLVALFLVLFGHPLMALILALFLII